MARSVGASRNVGGVSPDQSSDPEKQPGIHVGGDRRTFPPPPGNHPITGVPQLPLNTRTVQVTIGAQTHDVSIRYTNEALKAFEARKQEFQSQSFNDYLQQVADKAADMDVEQLKKFHSRLKNLEKSDPLKQEIYSVAVKVVEQVQGLKTDAARQASEAEVPLVDLVLNSARTFGDTVKSVPGSLETLAQGFGTLFRSSPPAALNQTQSDRTQGRVEGIRAVPPPSRPPLLSFPPRSSEEPPLNAPKALPTQRAGLLPTPRAGSTSVQYQGRSMTIDGYENTVCQQVFTTPQNPAMLPPHLTGRVLSAFGYSLQGGRNKANDLADVYFGRSVTAGGLAQSPFWGVKALLDFNPQTGEFSAYVKASDGAWVSHADATDPHRQAAQKLKADIQRLYQPHRQAEPAHTGTSVSSSPTSPPAETRGAEASTSRRKKENTEEGFFSGLLDRVTQN